MTEEGVTTRLCGRCVRAVPMLGVALVVVLRQRIAVVLSDRQRLGRAG